MKSDEAWNLYKRTNDLGHQWWLRWLWEDSQYGNSFWYHIAAASARAARLNQTLERDGRNRNSGLADPTNDKAHRARYIKLAKGDPSILEENWSEIQRLLFLDLKNGSSSLARSLADAIKVGSKATKDMIVAAETFDRATFDKAHAEWDSENPTSYSSEWARHLVQHWTSPPNKSDPPFCCWKDEALSSYFTHRASHQNSKPTHDFENCRDELGLIKHPVLILIEWNENGSVLLEPPPPPASDRIKNVFSKLTPDILRNAYPGKEAFYSVATRLLKMDKTLSALKEETRSHCYDWLRRYTSKERPGILVQEFTTGPLKTK